MTIEQLQAKRERIAQGAERDEVCKQYILMVAEEVVSRMPDKDVENYEL